MPLYLMYVDECGDAGMKKGSSNYFILSGLVVHEAYWTETMVAVTKMRAEIQEKYGIPADRELHAGEMLGRSKGDSLRVSRAKRVLAFRDVLRFEAGLDQIRIINVVVDKRKHEANFNPFEVAWDTLINRFENTIQYNNFPSPYEGKQPFQEKGLLIVDETDVPKLRSLTRQMRQQNLIPSSIYRGEKILHNLTRIIEDPVHKKSDYSPLIQLADANAYFLKQTIEPNGTMKKHKATNYFYSLEPVLLKEACRKNEMGIVWR